MRNIRWFLILVAIVGGGAWILLSQPAFQFCVQNGYPAQGADPEKKEPAIAAIAPGDWVGCAWRFAEDSADPLIAIFTVVLGLGTVALVVLTGDIVSGSENASRRQLRAYVGIEDVELVSPNLNVAKYVPRVATTNSGSPDSMVFRIKNFGLTPANRVHIWASWAGTPPGQRLPIDFKYADFVPEVDVTGDGRRPTWNRPTLFPGQIRPQTIGIDDLNPFIAASKGRCNLYVYGHVDYTDVFGKKRTTTFCLNCYPERPQGHRFSPYEEHNEAR